MKQVKKAVLQRMLRDLDYYSAGNLKIRDKDARLIPFQMNHAQQICNRKVAEQYKKTGSIRAIILKARQEGVSTWTAARFWRRLHLIPLQEAGVMADDKERAQTLFSIYDRFRSFLPPEMQPMTRYISKQTAMVLDNPDDKDRATNPGLGSKIAIETANDPNAFRGHTLQMVHASEMAFWEKPEDPWISLSQAVPDKNSEVIIESTANGIGNLFHQMWEAAVEGENEYLPIFLPWWIEPGYRTDLTAKPKLKEFIQDTLVEEEREWITAGIEFEGVRHKLTLEQVAWRRETIRNKLAGNDELFRQEYPGTPEEAFLVSGNAFFDQDMVKAYMSDGHAPALRGNVVRIGSSKAIIAKPASRGYLRLWLRPGQKLTPIDQEPLYVIGADTATGRQVSAQRTSLHDPDNEKGGRDFSSADVFDVRNRRFVAQLHGRMAPEVFAEQLRMLGIYFSNPQRDGTRRPCLIGVEKNHSSGETVLRVLQQTFRYPSLYYSRQINRRREKPKEVLGWQTSVETRQPMLDELSAAIREETVWLPNKDTLREMLTFVRGEDGKPAAQEGTHDDRVISSAIALQVARAQPQVDQRKLKDPAPKRGNSPTGMFSYD